VKVPPDSTKSTDDNDTRPNNYGNGITSLKNASWCLDGIYSNNRSKTLYTEPINKQADKRLFTPNKLKTGPNETHTEHNNGGTRTPGFLRVKIDNVTAKRLKKSNEQYTITGPPKFPDNVTLAKFHKWQCNLRRFVE